MLVNIVLDSFSFFNIILGFLKFEKSLTNVTRNAGDSVKLRCELSGDPPPDKIRWFKNEAPVRAEKGRVIIKRYRSGLHYGSRLRINEADTHDTGYYRCEASNGKHRVESTAIVLIKMVSWGRYPCRRQLSITMIISHY